MRVWFSLELVVVPICILGPSKDFKLMENYKLHTAWEPFHSVCGIREKSLQVQFSYLDIEAEMSEFTTCFFCPSSSTKHTNQILRETPLKDCFIKINCRSPFKKFLPSPCPKSKPNSGHVWSHRILYKKWLKSWCT